MAELPLEDLKLMAENAADLTQLARAQAEQCRDYYDGYQYTAEEIEILQARKQPIITVNRIQRKVDAMVGIEQRSRVDPRAYPRNPQDEDAADTATKALVYVEHATRFDAKRSAAFENMLIEGIGGVEITVEEKRGHFDVAVNRLRWEEIFFDPHSREKDFSDASYLGVMKWMTLDRALDHYAGEFEDDNDDQPQDGEDKGSRLEQILQATMANPSDGETYDDRPFEGTAFRWADKRQKRVRVAQMYYRRAGEWYLAIYTGGGEIRNGLSPYLDEDGKTCCPIELMTAYVDRENRRYGLVKSMLTIQDEINARRSKILHMMNTRQTMGIAGAVDVSVLKRELAKPDGHVEISPEVIMDAREMGMPAFSMMNNQDQAAGQFNLLVESKQEIDNLGPNASLLGQMQGAQSGRAIMAQQQAGLVELAPIYDSLRDWTLRCYRQMWSRIRQYWTDERWIRITDEMEAPQFVVVNKIIGYDPFTGQPVMENGVAETDVDIIIDEAPDMVTLRQEQFEQLTQMAQAGIPIPPEMLIESSNLRDKRRVLEAIREGQQQAAQQQMQAAQAEQQIEQFKIQSEAQYKAAQAQAAQARAAKDMASIPKAQAEARKGNAQAVGEEAEATVKAIQARAVVGF